MLLAELMETSESDGVFGFREGSEQGSGVIEVGAIGRPGRQLGGSAWCAFIVSSGFTVWIVCKGSGFTSGWRPRLRTCLSLSRGVACQEDTTSALGPRAAKWIKQYGGPKRCTHSLKLLIGVYIGSHKKAYQNIFIVIVIFVIAQFGVTLLLVATSAEMFCFLISL